ncbi:MAG: hypothetical protein HFK00_01315 [Oscillospiraceae bacterium]|nr:hypothetical protein [Oscillospiraceae bacterium]
MNNMSSSNANVNLIFADDFNAELPDIDSFQTFELKRKSNLSGQELYALFNETVEKYFPKLLSNEEKDLLYKINGTDNNGNFLSGSFIDNKSKILNDEMSVLCLWFTSKKAIIQMDPNGGVQTITGSAAFDLDDMEYDTIGMYSAADENKVIEKIHVPINGFENESSYHLLNGNESLDEAMNYTETFLNNEFDNGIAHPDLIADITDAWVVDMDNGIYGYHFWLTSTYNDIRFDTYPMKDAIGFGGDMSTCKSYSIYPGYAFMIEKDKLDSIMAFGYKRAYDIENIQTHELKITYDNAVEILSKSISSVVNMEINRAEFVYTPYEVNQYDNNNLIVDAAWKFSAKNRNDNLGYIFYVNAVTGEVDYYTY